MPEAVADRLIDTPEVAAMVGLMFDRLHGAIDHTMEFAKLRYPDEEQGAAMTTFVNGALYGAAALYMLESTDGGVDSDDIAFAWRAVTEMVGEVVDGPGGIDGALQRLCPEALGGDSARKEVVRG